MEFQKKMLQTPPSRPHVASLVVWQIGYKSKLFIFSILDQVIWPWPALSCWEVSASHRVQENMFGNKLKIAMILLVANIASVEWLLS